MEVPFELDPPKEPDNDQQGSTMTLSAKILRCGGVKVSD